jgi:hypothetical protein
MRHLSNRYGVSETMTLTLALWLCSLLVIGLFVAPFFGIKLAGIAALGLLVLLLAACWSLCVYRLPHPPERQYSAQHNPRLLQAADEDGPPTSRASEAAQSWVLIK